MGGTSLRREDGEHPPPYTSVTEPLLRRKHNNRTDINTEDMCSSSSRPHKPQWQSSMERGELLGGCTPSNQPHGHAFYHHRLLLVCARIDRPPGFTFGCYDTYNARPVP